MPPPASSFPQPWRTAVFLLCASAFNYADRASLTAILPALREELLLSDAQLGLLGSLFLWAYALGSPVAGVLGDRYARRKLVVGSLVVWSLVTLATGAVHSFRGLAALRLALGLAECIYIPTALALLMEQHGPASRGRAMSVASIGSYIGSVSGGTLCGALADRFSWRTGFIVLGVAGLGLALLARPFLGTGTTASAATAATPKPLIPVMEPFRYFLGTRTYLLTLVAIGLASLSVWVFMSWLPLYFTEKFHQSMGTAGFNGTFVISACSIVGVAVGGWLSDRVARIDGRHRLLLHATGFLLAAPFLLGFVAGLPFAALYACLACFSLLRTIGAANETPVMCDVVPSAYRGTAQGLQNTVALASSGVGVLLTGILKARFGLETIFVFVGGMLMLAAVVYFCAYRFFLRADTERARCRGEELEPRPSPA